MLQIIFPEIKLDDQVLVPATGMKLSFALGWVNLAVMKLVQQIIAVPLQFSSNKHVSTAKLCYNPLPAVTEQRDVQKTTKIQITASELVKPCYGGKQCCDDIN